MTFKEKVNEICTLVPAFNREIDRRLGTTREGKDYVKYVFKNGSYFDNIILEQKIKEQEEERLKKHEEKVHEKEAKKLAKDIEHDIKKEEKFAKKENKLFD